MKIYQELVCPRRETTVIGAGVSLSTHPSYGPLVRTTTSQIPVSLRWTPNKNVRRYDPCPTDEGLIYVRGTEGVPYTMSYVTVPTPTPDVVLYPSSLSTQGSSPRRLYSRPRRTRRVVGRDVPRTVDRFQDPFVL